MLPRSARSSCSRATPGDKLPGLAAQVCRRHLSTNTASDTFDAETCCRFSRRAYEKVHMSCRHVLRRADFDAVYAQAEMGDFKGVQELLARLQNPF